MMTPSAAGPSACRKLRISPSALDWKQRSSTPSSAARPETRSSMSFRVVEPYISGWRLPRRFRLGPLTSRIRIRFVPTGASVRLAVERLQVRFSLPLFRDVGVYLGRGGAGVAQQLLHYAEI